MMHKNPFTKQIRQWVAVGTGLFLLLLALAAVNILPSAAASQRAATLSTIAAAAPVQVAPGGPQVGRDIKHDTSPPLRSIPIASFTAKQAPENDSVGRLYKTGVERVQDPVLQTAFNTLAPNAMPGTIKNFEGVNSRAGSAPPDTIGEAGLNHYIQMTNGGFQIFDKTSQSLYGPAPNQSLWYGFGGTCEFNNDGDPIVLYDQLADRWFMSQFAVPGDNRGYHECVAISATGDPLGTWHRYDFFLSQTIFFDYPQFGVWPDGYYGSFNLFDAANNNAFVGAALTVLDRAQMLAGQPATIQIFTDPGFGGYLASDLDGSALPPAGAPNLFAEPDTNTTGEVRARNFHVDWNNPANSYVTNPFTVTIAPWNWLCPTVSRQACVQEPAPGSNLAGLGDRFMRRLAYRNFGDHQAWVTNFTVDASTVVTQPLAGIRWLELRATGSVTPTLYQEGTYTQNDGVHRWTGSVAMDQQGNMALGYSVSSSSLFPGIRYTGRLVTDTLGTLPQGEAILLNGSGVQLSPNRWGDYSSLTIDPADDCTFWYTNEYYQINGNFRWQTRIGSFKFPGCTAGAATPTVTGTPPTAEPTVTPHSTATNTPGAAPSATPTAIIPCSTNAIQGSISGDLPRESARIAPDFLASACDAPKGPRTTIAGTPRYNAYTFYNPTGGPQCVTVRIESQCNYFEGTRLFSAAYLGSFNPSDPTQNYLGDIGGYTQNQNTYQFTVPANSTYVVVVNEYVQDTGCPGYTLSVSCGIQGGTPTATTTAVASATAPAATVTATAPAATATATPVVNCPLPFTDVDQFNPFYQYIQCLYCRGIISGYSDNTFRWGNDVTRGQVSKIIANSAGLNGAVSGQTFTDVDPGNPFYVYIERLVATGAISGYNTAANCPTGIPCFRWELPVTRGQLAKIDANAAGYNETPTGQTFRDVPPSQPFYQFIERLSLHGVINGYDCGGPGEPCPGLYYRPNANITRGQVSKVAAQTFFPNACAPAPPPSATATVTVTR